MYKYLFIFTFVFFYVSSHALSDKGILCNLYFSNENYDKAFSFCKEAAEIDDEAVVQHHLAYMFSEGLEVERNLQKAAFWFEKAAENDDVFSQNKLAFIYYKGLGVDRDLGKAAFLV